MLSQDRGQHLEVRDGEVARPGAQDFLRDADDTQRFRTSRKCNQSTIVLLPNENSKIINTNKKSIPDMSATFPGEGSLGSVGAS